MPTLRITIFNFSWDLKLFRKLLNFNLLTIIKIFLMTNYTWFYPCYLIIKEDEQRKEIFLTLPTWFFYPQINFTNANYFFCNLKNFDAKMDSCLWFSLHSTRSNYWVDKEAQLGSLLPSFIDEKDLQSEVFSTLLPSRKSSFISFFIDNMIDVPICFKKSASLRFKNFEFPLLKFSNLLMKKGKKEQVFNILINSLVTFFQTLKSEKILPLNIGFSWYELFIYLNSTIFINNNFLYFPNNAEFDLKFKNLISSEGKVINNTFFMKNYLFSRLTQIVPVFSFFVYNVDKNIRKYSRGKSGKYVFIWKYIASYKRLFVAFKWLVRDIKFNNDRKITSRIITSLTQLTSEPYNTFAWRSHQFAHNYVFRNLRKSLMSSLRTTT